MKKQIIVGLSLLVFGVVQAQIDENYIHFNLGGGEQNLSYTLQNGTEKAQSGYTINATYSHIFISDWGFQTGLGVHSYGALSTLNYQSATPNVIDAAGDSYEFRVNYKNWQEKQQALFVNIPLELQYLFLFSDKFSVLTGFGASVSIPLKANYKTVGGEMVTTGYYSKWNVELSDLPLHGFSTYTGSYSGNLSLKPAYTAIFDFGGLYKLSDKLDLYFGGYFNYGLNNVVTSGSKSVYQPDGTYNGFLGSDQVNKVTPIAFGVKVGIYWRLGKKHVTYTPEIEVMPTVPVESGLQSKMQNSKP